MISAAAELIRQADRILVICHVAPDGDAIGSLLGLGRALEKLGKHPVLACADPVPRLYRYLPGQENITAHPQGEFDLVISLDCSDLQRLGAPFKEADVAGKPIINIDHHITNVNFGTVNWVDTSAAATAQMVLELVEYLGVPLDPDMATCLLNGIVTDTQGFRTPNTTPRVVAAALRLMEAGASLPYIAQQVFNRRPISQIRLWARALTEMQLDGRVLWATITPDMRRDCQMTEDGDGGLVGFLVSAVEADVAIVFAQQEDGTVEVSMRAVPGIDVSGVAFSLGGGGHPQAAGCKLQPPLEEAQRRVLQAVKEALRRQTGQ